MESSVVLYFNNKLLINIFLDLRPSLVQVRNHFAPFGAQKTTELTSVAEVSNDIKVINNTKLLKVS